VVAPAFLYGCSRIPMGRDVAQVPMDAAKSLRSEWGGDCTLASDPNASSRRARR